VVERVNGILAAHANEAAAFLVTWHIGHVPAADSAGWGTVRTLMRQYHHAMPLRRPLDGHRRDAWHPIQRERTG
jgi:hypothetical protein